jgi:CheY-like chemotaxis protein
MYPLRRGPTPVVSSDLVTAAVAPTVDGSLAPRILVVEDGDEARTFVTRVLTAEGYAVTEARHGAAALRLVEDAAEPFDLVVTDVMMPVMSGYKLGRRLGACRPGLPVLYMSASSNDPSDRRGRAPNLPPELMPLLRKPLLREDLVREVAALIPRGAPVG